MPKTSAGILLYRRAGVELQLLIVHPGGPFFRNKDAGWWSLPKGEPEVDEPLVEAAIRELMEEVGVLVAADDLIPLGHVRQKGGKVVHAWACRWDGPELVDQLPDHTFEMQWPPRSGRMQRFPEIDRALWVAPTEAERLLNAAQAEFVGRLTCGRTL